MFTAVASPIAEPHSLDVGVYLEALYILYLGRFISEIISTGLHLEAEISCFHLVSTRYFTPVEYNTRHLQREIVVFQTLD